MADKASELLALIQAEFEKIIENGIPEKYAEAIKGGTADFKLAANYCDTVGESCSKALREYINGKYLTADEFTKDVAEALIVPLLGETHKLSSKYCAEVMQVLNEKAGIGLAVQRTKFYKNTARKLAEDASTVASLKGMDSTENTLGDSVVLFARAVADRTIDVNAAFHAGAGYRPRIRRRAESKCCKWCSDLAGAWDYENRPDDVFSRHENCRCLVEYFPGDGRRQNVHSKEWSKLEAGTAVGTDAFTTSEKDDIIQSGETKGIKSLLHEIVEHPETLERYTPASLKSELEKEGNDVKVLGQGRWKNVPFEDGGGYKVNFGAEGILMYHPAEHSHHGGEYYKISTGRKGTHHYYVNGKEFLT